MLAGGDEDLFEIREALELEGTLVVRSTCTVCDKTKLLGLSQNKKKIKQFQVTAGSSAFEIRIKAKGASVFEFSVQEL